MADTGRNKTRRGFYTGLALLAITVLGASLRLWDLGDKSFWSDELISLCSGDAIQNVKTFLTPSCGNAHPPLYFLLVKIWASFGQGEVYFRLLPVIFGIAVIPAGFILAYELLGRRVAILTALLVAVSPFHLLYDRELRMYSLLTFLALFSLYFFLRALRGGRSFHWFMYTVISTLSVYVHYHAFLILLFEWAYFFIRYPVYRHHRVKAIVSQLFIGGVFAFWLPGLIFQIQHPELFTLDHPDKFPIVIAGWLVKPLYLLFAVSLGQTILPWNVVALAGALAFGAVAVLGARSLKKEKEVFVFVLLYLSLPFLAGSLIFSSMPKYYLFLAPVYYLVIAKGLLSIPRVQAQAVVLSILLVPVCVSIINYFHNREFHILAQVDPWRGVGKYIREHQRTGDCLVAIGSGITLSYYTNHFEGFAQPIYGNHFKDSVECLDAGAGRQLWLVGADSGFQRVTNDARSWFDGRYARMDEKKFFHDPDRLIKSKLFKKNFLDYRIKVYLYEKKEDRPPRME